MHWLYPKVLTAPSERLFQDSWDLSRGSYNTIFISAANKLLSTIMLRRTKSVVECNVPPKEELTVFIPMTEAQRFWTLGLLTRLDVVELEKIFQSQNEVKGDGKSTEFLAHMKQGTKLGCAYPSHRGHCLIDNDRSLLTVYKRLQNLLMQLRMVCDQYVVLCIMSSGVSSCIPSAHTFFQTRNRPHLSSANISSRRPPNLH